jgi:pimeloyl-ACP methyl ester carboxylesterase
MEWFDELQRVSSDGETAARLREARDRLDVTELAPRVASPALVLHARGDRMVPLEEGRLLAELVPGARFVPLASRNHILLVSEMAWATFLGQVDSFLHADDEALVAAPRAG